jgi:hypothetical protein
MAKTEKYESAQYKAIKGLAERKIEEIMPMKV